MKPNFFRKFSRQHTIKKGYEINILQKTLTNMMTIPEEVKSTINRPC